MLSSVLATFDDTNKSYVKTVMNELRQDENLNVRTIVFGRLFDKLTASIIVPEMKIEAVFEKLLVNGIHIYPYNEEYKQRIDKTYSKLKKENSYVKDRVRTFYAVNTRYKSKADPKKEQLPNLDSSDTAKSNTVPKEKKNAKKDLIKPNFEFLLKNQEATNYTIIDKLCSEGDYVTIGNIVKRNPVMNSYAKEKYIPAIKNCIKLNLEKGLKTPAYVNQAVEKLKQIINNKEISAITSEDLISAAGNALLAICSEQDPLRLISIANLANSGQRLNVLAFVKLSELIFPNGNMEEINKSLLRQVVEKLNTQYVLICYDVMETQISETNRIYFNRLYDEIIKIKQGTSTLL